MSANYEAMVDALRAEISEYGGLLNSFNEQQSLLLAHDATGVLRMSTEIERQLSVLQGCRANREQLVADFAASHGQSREATMRSLLPFVDPAYRPQLEALIKEVNVLIHRLRRINGHNHTLLTAAVNSRREVLRTLRPEAFVQTYSATGRVSVTAPSTALKSSG